MKDKGKIVISKPIATRPRSNLRSFTALLTDPLDSTPPPTTSLPQKTVAIKPKTTRFRPSRADSTEFLSSADDLSELPADYLSEEISVPLKQGVSSSNILYKPTAKLAPRTTVSLLGSFDANYPQPANIVEQEKPSENQPIHHEEFHSQIDMVQAWEQSNLEPQNMEQDTEKSQQQFGGRDRPSYDGYNWRKYGQKQVKGSEYPRSYYKCTDPSCPVKKKVERTLDGQIAEIVYKGEHNHPKPQTPKRTLSGSQGRSFTPSEHSKDSANCWSNPLLEVNVSAELTENRNSIDPSENPTAFRQMQCSKDPLSPAVFDDSAKLNRSATVSADNNKLSYKRRRSDDKVSTENKVADGASDHNSAMQGSVESNVSGDGFHWRKYGQKVVKGNSYPRSYYRCTYPRCNVRKYVERVSDDPGSFVTTYEGKHSHDAPSAKSNQASSKS